MISPDSPAPTISTLAVSTPCARPKRRPLSRIARASQISMIAQAHQTTNTSLGRPNSRKSSVIAASAITNAALTARKIE